MTQPGHAVGWHDEDVDHWLDSLLVIDVDAHVTEPPDLWTSRTSSKYAELVPHLERIEGLDIWVADGGRYTAPAGMTAVAESGSRYPGPDTYAGIHASAWDRHARLEMMDALGIFAQVLYPNVGGFGHAVWTQMSDKELALACVRAYNEFITDFCSASPERLLAVTAIPFWDVDASIEEIDRGLSAGHRAVNFTNNPEGFGLPHLWDRYWDPIWSLAQDADVPISFHLGSGNMRGQLTDRMRPLTALARLSSTLYTNNIRCIADLIFGGVFHRFPGLSFVSVESGAGFWPSALEFMDWNWQHLNVVSEHPEYDLMPSEYFVRQGFGCFWFEDLSLEAVLTAYPDNMLYETDFPHPAGQYPTPGTTATTPQEYMARTLDRIPPDVRRKVLSENAARLYKVPAASGDASAFTAAGAAARRSGGDWAALARAEPPPTPITGASATLERLGKAWSKTPSSG